ncbi:cys-loop ligand-gated ion channel-like isoform X2 [Lineus longissimus]|uniref:cys-loop ligand-gated ion channel-like isoform X2 n=1 Tax=Lineus longissimus TaxID=88925 RepID=UPI00315DCC2F
MEPVLARVAQTVVPWDAAPHAQASDITFCGIGDCNYNHDHRMGMENEACNDACDDAVCLLETDLDTNCTLRRRKYPKRVEVCVVFLKVGEIDTIKEQFNADVLVKARWREPSMDKSEKEAKAAREQPRQSTMDPDSIWHPRLFIENTIGEPKESIFRSPMWMENGEAYMTEKRRVKGTFLENLELMDFPFDVQDLTCTVASDRPQTEVELISDANDIHRVNKQSFVDEQEWSLYKHIEAEPKVLTYEHADPTFQRQAMSVKCRAARRPAYFFWNIFLITFLICSLSFATFSVKHTLPQNRLQLSFTLILTSVAFKFIVNQSLPKISYLTYLDKYVLASMIMLAIICVWHCLVTVIDDNARSLSPENPEEFMQKVEKGMVGFLLSFYILYNVAFSIRIYFSACRRRRMMKQKDKEYMEKIEKLEQKVKKKKFFRRQSSREVPRNEHVIVNTTTDTTWL